MNVLNNVNNGKKLDVENDTVYKRCMVSVLKKSNAKPMK